MMRFITFLLFAIIALYCLLTDHFFLALLSGILGWFCGLFVED